MKLHEILAEEMGKIGMNKIKKNFSYLINKLNFPIKEFSINQKGSIFIIYKNKKPFAKIPQSKIMNNNYIISVLKRDM